MEKQYYILPVLTNIQKSANMLSNILIKKNLNAQTNNNGLTATHYLAVEKDEDGSETKILKILCECKNVDFLPTCNSGFNQLEWSIHHLNLELIREIVSEQFRKKCGITRQIL